jgi:hypothetical protein
MSFDIYIYSVGVEISRVESGVRVLVGWAKTTPGPKLGARAYIKEYVCNLSSLHR